MTIDEAIEILKNGGYLTNREEKQIAEWLEKLKAIKSDGFTYDLLNMGFTKGYNKAIDDFATLMKAKINKDWATYTTYGPITYNRLIDKCNEIAEQLSESLEHKFYYDRLFKKMEKHIRETAIDDAKSVILQTLDNEILVDTLHLRLEQLKAGVTSEADNQ